MEKPAKGHLPKAPLIRVNFTYSGNIWEEVWWYINTTASLYSMELHVSPCLKDCCTPMVRSVGGTLLLLTPETHCQRERATPRLRENTQALSHSHSDHSRWKGESKGENRLKLTCCMYLYILISDLVRVLSMAYEFMSGKYHTSGETNVHPKAPSSGISQSSFENRGLLTMSSCLTSCKI